MNRFVSCDPATGETISTFPICSAEEVVCAVERVCTRLSDWSARSVSKRCHHLTRLRDSLAGDAETLAQILTRETGKPLQEAYGAEILPAITALNWLIQNAPRLLRPRSVQGARYALLSPQPYGVVGVIGTWNYPLLLDLTPIAWALAAGNIVVWKPSELASASACALQTHIERAGLPVTLLTGDATTGRALCRAPIDKLVFTGGAAMGHAILAELAVRGVPSVMELSGNDAMIVCADADVGVATRSAVWARCANAGQSCIAPQRLYVASEIYDRFLLESALVIDSLRPGIDLGPLRTAALQDRIDMLVHAAIASGARLVRGGRPLGDLPGCYYAPTLLAECTDEMDIMAQDCFGPVLPVCRVRSEGEAVERTNRNAMALGVSVWTRNAERGRQIAQSLQVGMVAINQEMLLAASDPALPFGGLRASGFGKQRGAMGLEEFVQWKAIVTGSRNDARRHQFPYRAATLPILRGLIALQVAHTPAQKIRAASQTIRAALRWKKARV